MRRLVGELVLLLLSSILAGRLSTSTSIRTGAFVREDVPDAQRPDFDDQEWVVVSAPHTYNDVETFGERA